MTWRSESPSVATVNSATGEVKGMAPGKAVITAISGSNTDTCEITVKGILLDETSLTMNERDTHTLKANPYGSLGTLKWTSSRPGNRHGHRGTATSMPRPRRRGD